jgi:hypothetical protein
VAATISAKRRFLLLELNEAGLFEASKAPDRRSQLERLQLPNLLAYHTAAMELLSYLASPARKRLFPDSGSDSVIGASVSIDCFACTSQPLKNISLMIGLHFASQSFAKVTMVLQVQVKSFLVSDRSGMGSIGEEMTA